MRDFAQRRCLIPSFHLIACQPSAFYDPFHKRGEVSLAREQRKLAAMLAANGGLDTGAPSLLFTIRSRWRSLVIDGRWIEARRKFGP